MVQPHPQIEGAYQVLAGHRRLAAARLASRDQVPVVIRGPPPGVAVEELMLVENCHRRDLSPMDKAQAMGALRAHGYTAARIARSIGLAESTVSFYLTLLDLAPAAQAKVRSGELSAADAVAAMRQVRKRHRARDGKPTMGGGEWEPDHFTTRHPLAKKARAMCEAREHSMRRHVGRSPAASAGRPSSASTSGQSPPPWPATALLCGASHDRAEADTCWAGKPHDPASSQESEPPGFPGRSRFFLILDLAIGGGYPDGVCGCTTPAASTSSGAAMLVRSVAVYVHRN